MPNDYDRVLEQLRDAGVQEEYVESLEKMLSASPIRKEKEEYKAAAAEAKALNIAYRDRLLNTELARLGVKVKADALRIPDDLDPLDGVKVTEWAVASGLAEAPASPNVPAEELAGVNRLEAASNGGGQPPSIDMLERINNATSEAEVMALAREAGIPIAGSG